MRIARDGLAELYQGGGAVEDYNFKFRKLALKAPTLSTDEAVDKYVRGLDPDIRLELERNYPITLEEASALAQRMDENLRRVREANAPPVRMQGRRETPEGVFLAQSRTEPMRCYACGKAGHKARDCPSGGRARQSGGRK